MRAAVIREMGKPRPYAGSRPFTIAEVELEPPGEGEVLVRIRAAGLCHSDLNTVTGDRRRPMPMVLGHEAAGEVVELGAGVNDLAAGDHVILVFVPSCGACPACMEGRPGLCAAAAAANAAGTLISGARRIRWEGQPVHHHLGVSAFAEYAVVSRHSLVRIDDDLPFEAAALFGCAVVTGVGAVFNTARLPAGASVAVIGLGGVGLMALLAARAAGARQVMALDISDDKLTLAGALGATHAVNATHPDAAEQARALSGGGVEFAFEMAGSVQALELAYAVTGRGGTTVTAGLPHREHRFALPASSLVHEERTLKGSYIGSCVPGRDIPRYIALYRRGLLPVDQVLSGRSGLDTINEGFDRLADGAAVRQILLP